MLLKSIHVHDTLCKHIFENNDSIEENILKNIRGDDEKKKILVIDNANLLLASYNNPCKLVHFMQNFRKTRGSHKLIIK